MKLKKLGKQLRKINNLYSQIEEEQDISSLELDLLKEYTREFYKKLNQLEDKVSEPDSLEEIEEIDDQVLETNEITDQAAEEPEPKQATNYKYKIGEISDQSIKKKKKNIAEKVAKEKSNDSIKLPLEPDDFLNMEVSDLKEANIQKKEIEEKPEKKNDFEEEVFIPNIELDIEEATVEVEEKLEQNKEDKIKTVEKEASHTQPAPQASIKNPVYDELFEMAEITDLSDKLSNAPIDDIRSSMGLNERVLTINELFAGNAMAFDKVVKKLNGLNSFSEARAFLSEEVVPNFGWNEENKIKKAKVFLKLINRRYQS